MSAEFPALERGQAAAATKRKHIPTWLYKQAHRLTDEMTEIHNEIENIGTFNAGKQKEKVLKLLMDWYPRINAFESKLKPYDDQLKILRENESAFRYETEQAQWALQKERQEGQSLIYELREYQDFINSIPESLREELIARYEHEQQTQEQTQTY